MTDTESTNVFNSSDGGSLAERKARHLEICVRPDVYAVETNQTGLDGVRFVHRAVAEKNLADCTTETEFLGLPISIPVFISSMTGGSDEAYRVNRELARAAQIARIPVGMGSMRILFRKPEVIDHFRLKRIAPDVPVFTNIGGVQLPQISHSLIIETAKKIEVDAIAVHLNIGQELFQADGDTEFRGVLDGIRRLCEASPLPIIVKETGFGISPVDVAALLDAGVRYVDLAGAGGTNWVRVEAHRSDDTTTADEFSDWGLPTGVLLGALARTGDGRKRDGILASGGIRTGMEVAKCLALGAEAVGLALPFVRDVTSGGADAVVKRVEDIRTVLRSVMIMTDVATPRELRSVPLWSTRAFSDESASLAATGTDGTGTDNADG